MLIADSECTACSRTCILNAGRLGLQSRGPGRPVGRRGQTIIHPKSTSGVDRGHQSGVSEYEASVIDS